MFVANLFVGFLSIPNTEQNKTFANNRTTFSTNPILKTFEAGGITEAEADIVASANDTDDSPVHVAIASADIVASATPNDTDGSRRRGRGNSERRRVHKAAPRSIFYPQELAGRNRGRDSPEDLGNAEWTENCSQRTRRLTVRW